MTNYYYPVVHDFHNLQHGGSGAIHQSPLSLPSHHQLQQVKVTPITSDGYLLEIFKCVCQIMHAAMPKIAFKFPPLIIKIQWTITVSLSAPSPLYAPCEPSSLEFEQEDVVPGTSSGVISIHNALLMLIAAQLYSNRLIEMLQKKADLADTVDRWRSLKKYLIEFSIFIDKVIQIYTHDSCINPEVEDLKKIKNRLTKLISRANVDEIKKMFEDGISVSDVDLVTAALGLDGSVSSAICEIRKGSCNHQTDQYHITDSICKAVEENCLEYDPDTEMMKILVDSGFASARASILAEKLQEDELSSLQPLMYWVELYLDHMFEYDLFLNSEYARFPFNADKVNVWSVVLRTLDKESAGETTPFSVNVWIYNSSDGLDAITRDGVAYPPREVEENVWYHATDHKSAQDILLGGISLVEGKGKQDFSHQYGFYLTPHLGFAKEWAMRKGGHSRGAIIVFRCKIDATAYKGLDLCLEGSVNKWTNVVKYYRSGTKSRLFNPPPGLVAELNITDYIEGPMSGDQTKCTNTEWQPTKKQGDSNQLCIKSEKLANEFSNGIDSIIFLWNNNYSHKIVG